MSLALIRSAFESRLKTWANAQTPAIPIAYENLAFTPPLTRYLRAYVLPAKTDSNTLDDVARTYQGLFQVSIVVPLNEGAGNAQTLAAAIAGLYPSSFIQGSIRVYCSPMSEGVPQQEPNYFVLPIRFTYQVEV